ncbi:hypothetical protein XarbCFBP8142_19790 [Xanthomonas arboricola]|nr:hypothetical protein XarbCFBP8142_19790 [Xanthomonas arboricola]
MRRVGSNSLVQGADMLSQEASAVVASFGQQPGVTREHLDNFNRVLNDSPELTRQIVAASRYQAGPSITR